MLRCSQSGRKTVCAIVTEDKELLPGRTTLWGPAQFSATNSGVEDNILARRAPAAEVFKELHQPAAVVCSVCCKSCTYLQYLLTVLQLLAQLIQILPVNGRHTKHIANTSKLMHFPKSIANASKIL